MSKIREEADMVIRYASLCPTCEMGYIPELIDLMTQAGRVLLLEKAHRYQRAARKLGDFLYLYKDFLSLEETCRKVAQKEDYIYDKAEQLYKQAEEL